MCMCLLVAVVIAKATTLLQMVWNGTVQYTLKVSQTQKSFAHLFAWFCWFFIITIIISSSNSIIIIMITIILKLQGHNCRAD